MAIHLTSISREVEGSGRLGGSKKKKKKTGIRGKTDERREGNSCGCEGIFQISS